MFELTRPRKSALALAARIAQHGWSSPIVRADVPPDTESDRKSNDGARREPVELVLRPVLGCVVHGLVFDGPSARATSGHVEVHFRGVSEARPTADAEPERYPIAANGTFELRLPVGRTATLRAVLPSGPSGERKLVPDRSVPSVYLTLNAFPRGGISGRLVDLSGRPLPGFRVHAAQRITRATDGAFQRGSRHTEETGPDGHFVFEGERARPTQLKASGPKGSRAQHWPLAQEVTPGSARDETYTLPLGRVLVSATNEHGEPLELVHSTGIDFGVAGSTAGTSTLVWVRDPVSPDPRRAGIVLESVPGDGWIHAQGFLPPVEERGARVAGFRGGELLMTPDAAPGRELQFLALAGHSYRLELHSWGYEDFEEQVWVPDSGGDVTVELHPHALGESTEVEFALLEASGAPFPGPATWILSAHRSSGPIRARLPATRGEPAHVALPPGTYAVQIAFETGAALAASWWSLRREITIDADGPRRFEFQVGDAEARPKSRQLLDW